MHIEVYCVQYFTIVLVLACMCVYVTFLLLANIAKVINQRTIVLYRLCLFMFM